MLTQPMPGHYPKTARLLPCPHCTTPLQPYPLLPLFPKDCYWCATCARVVLCAKEDAA